MGLDIRLPIGLMFLTLGPVLLAFGLSQDVSMDVQVGGAMSAFGGMMAAMGRRADRRSRRLPGPPSS